MVSNVTQKVNELYEQYPFPSLEINSKKDLLEGTQGKLMNKIFRTANLKRSWFKRKKVLEAGCGTGEKSVFFALLGAEVTAVDYSRASLKKAAKLAQKFDVEINFQRQNLLEWEPQQNFDYTISSGVLHHTPEPKKVFDSLCKCTNYFSVGLYHKYGRIPVRLKQFWLHLLYGDDLEKKRNHLNAEGVWGINLMDRYAHPYESNHTIQETRDWFEENGFEVVGQWPQKKDYEFFFSGNTFFFVSGKVIKE